jgi:hypothetical protein
MSDKPVKEFPLQTAIELACAAMRSNDGYISENSSVFAPVDANRKFSNKELMLIALGEISSNKYEEYPVKPALLCTNKDDQALATDIQKFYKRLLFTAIEGADEFRTSLFTVLNKETVPQNRLGFVACLPTAYFRDRYDTLVKRVGTGHIGLVGDELSDLDCEIIKTSRSKNYDAWNIDAIIDNKLVSWMSKQRANYGPAVLIKGKVKDHSKHWKHPEINVTRLNYVKVFQ